MTRRWKFCIEVEKSESEGKKKRSHERVGLALLFGTVRRWTRRYFYWKR